MDCEACTDRLVELLYGELPDEDAEETRAHLDRCDSCSEAFARIDMGRGFADLLVLESAPASILDGVLAAARERAAERAPAPLPAAEEPATPPRPDEDEDAGPWAAFLKWVGGFAMRPQLAMALSLFLIVGLGMWYLPTLRESDPADSHAIVDPAPGDEVGPSNSLVPAEPLDLEADPRTGRIRPREEGEEDAPPPRVAAVHPPTADPEGPEAPAEPDPDPEVRPNPTPTTERMPVIVAEADTQTGEVIEEALPDPRAASVDLAPGQATAQEAQLAVRPTVRAPVPAMASQVESAPVPPPVAPQAPAPAATDRYAQGLQHYRERNYRQAADDFESVVERPGPDARVVPSALHHLARSQRAAGNCAAAVRTYERLLSQHPTYSGNGEAMIEGAGCYDRLGRLSDARRLLERARNVPSVANDANRMLAVIAQRERASEAVPAAPDVPTSTPE
ncbi:MAG: tetratricopeptide repeat protein [Myxococcales bacterium]|nr:tetratricopeptide repeat protein [Myxococcales bacterium]